MNTSWVLGFFENQIFIVGNIRESGDVNGKEDYLPSLFIYTFFKRFCTNRPENQKRKLYFAFIEVPKRRFLEKSWT